MSPAERDERAYAAVAGARPNSKGWARGDCPFCMARVGKPDRKQCFGLNARTGRMHCFRCGFSARLRGVFDPRCVQVEAEHQAGDGVQPPEDFRPLFEGDLATALCAREPREYLTRVRGLDQEHLLAAGVGACLRGEHAGRVVVPVLGEDRTWLWWVGRVWTKHAERTYRYPAGDRTGVIYNHAALLEETDQPVLVVEGVFDALWLWPWAVAVLGKHNEAQLAALAAARRPVVAVLDGDAWREGEMLALRLRMEEQRAGSVRLPAGTDPDEHPAEAVMRAAERSLGAFGAVGLG